MMRLFTVFGSVAVMSSPVPLIVDTDMSTDVDDVLALAVAHALVARGEADLLAVVHNTGLPTGVGAVSVVNHYYGRDDVLIGAYKGKVDNPDFSEMLQPGRSVAGPYVDNMVMNFSSPIQNYSQVPTAVEVYRSALVGQEDGSVVIANIGFNLNLWDLLRSGPDATSNLTGVDLVAKKVKAAYVMGGQYPTSVGGGGGYEGDNYEWNFGGGCHYHAVSCPVTPEATFFTINNWPEAVPVIFLGFEVGNVIYTGSPLTDESSGCSTSDGPVRASYLDYGDWNEVYPVRQSWDEATVLAAVRGAGELFVLSPPGTNTIREKDGGNTFVENADGPHRYLILPDSPTAASAVASVIDELICEGPVHVQQI